MYGKDAYSRLSLSLLMLIQNKRNTSPTQSPSTFHLRLITSVKLLLFFRSVSTLSGKRFALHWKHCSGRTAKLAVWLDYLRQVEYSCDCKGLRSFSGQRRYSVSQQQESIEMDGGQLKLGSAAKGQIAFLQECSPLLTEGLRHNLLKQQHILRSPAHKLQERVDTHWKHRSRNFPG